MHFVIVHNPSSFFFSFFLFFFNAVFCGAVLDAGLGLNITDTLKRSKGTLIYYDNTQLAKCRG